MRNTQYMRFKYNLLHFDKLQRQSVDGKRFYQLPSGKLVKSVTTIIGEKTDKTFLVEWEKRVGKDNADKIRLEATRKGTAIHGLLEQYCRGEDPVVMPLHQLQFNKIKNVLNQNVGTIYGIESFLYSEKYNTAGQTDLICEFAGSMCIVDFKNTKKKKHEQYIQNYFVQATVYSLMFEHLHSIKCPKICVILAQDDHFTEPQVFFKDRDQYVDKVNQIFDTI